MRALSGCLQIEVLLKRPEDLPDIWTQIRHGIGDRVVVLQAQQRRQLLLVELLDADADIVLEDEIEKGLLPGAEL